MAKIAPQGRLRYADADGKPLAGGKLFTYEAGTTTPKATYTDNTGNTPNANPVVLDANGYADVWLGGGGYKFVLKDANDATLWSVDNIDGGSATGFASNVISRSSSFGLTGNDQNSVVVCAAALTISLMQAAIAGDGYAAVIINASAGNVTLDPDGSETINGAGTLVIEPGASVTIHTDGIAWFAGRGAVADGAITPSKLSFGVTGIVVPFAGSAAPTGWLLCYGQTISRTTYSSLFTAIGTTYGSGDGSTTFNLPDLRGRAVFGLDNMGGGAANRITNGNSGITGTTLGAAGGSELMQQHNHVLTDPGHTHVQRVNTGGGSSLLTNGATLGGDQASNSSTSSKTTGITLADAGAGASQNVPPAMVLNYIIKT